MLPKDHVIIYLGSVVDSFAALHFVHTIELHISRVKMFSGKFEMVNLWMITYNNRFSPYQAGCRTCSTVKTNEEENRLGGKKYKLKGESGSEKKQQLVSLKKRKKF
jgi:hypothetical protein